VKSLVLHFGRPYRTIGADRLLASKQYPADGGDGERGFGSASACGRQRRDVRDADPVAKSKVKAQA
jgi:hypothetical protein